ncbi:MAG TPA: ATP-binding protein [Puia sp.]|nr:ATP-binding protein [Puia sp.]
MSATYAQPYYNRLLQQLKDEKDDSAKVLTLCALAQYHAYTQSDSNAYYVDNAIKLSDRIDYPNGKLQANIELFFAANFKADYTLALEIALNNLKIASELKDHRLYKMALIMLNLNLVNREMGDNRKAAVNQREAFDLQERSGEIDGDFWAAYSWKSVSYIANPDSALYFGHKGYEMAKTSPRQYVYVSLAAAYLGNAYRAAGKYDTSRKYLQIALEQCIAYNNVYIQGRVYRDLATLFNKSGQIDSCIYFSKTGLALCLQYHFGDYASQLSQLLANAYEFQHKPDSALKYIKVMGAAKDSIFSQAKMLQFQKLLSDADQKQKEAEADAEKYRTQVRLYSLIAIACIFLILLLVVYRNNRQKQKAYTLITKQKQETDLQKTKVEEAYVELKSAQNQLIQSEKMASLGELTAGIAHEIQNPLNFVNNFSEVNTELIEELKGERQKPAGERNASLENEILNNIAENEEKINHHGKRADAIVKGMLQHSRLSVGVKELTDINALAEEYLRLSYHGLRAKDNSFNAAMKTDFDISVGKINIVPQDIGRVLLNLYNNAFYALAERRKSEGKGYEPTIFVGTKKSGNNLLITVRDNGNGIPQRVIAKIFQPFFTTKPTGQGTGLGLSLSYDIIKAHGGEIKVEAAENEGSLFIIQLPKTYMEVNSSGTVR